MIRAGNATSGEFATARWRWAAVALVTLSLCSCRAVTPGAHPPALPRESAEPDAFAGDEPAAYDAPAVPMADCEQPLPETLLTPWSPPGIEQPWPADEYLHDGGDREVPASVGRDWQIGGLETEDTIVHFDTIDGRRLVEPSNRVHIYAPRFGAVRKVENLFQDQQNDALVQATKPVRLQVHDDRAPPKTAVQPLGPRGQIGTRSAGIARRKQADGKLVDELRSVGVQGGFLPFENLLVIRQGQLDQKEKARLIESIDAAIVWSHEKAVQVVLDNKPAIVFTGDARAQATFSVDVPNNPRLRIIKVASTNTALPGDLVDFTLRFDNIGDQQIGNVTIVDNLTTRLEYVDGSQQSSRKAEFSSQRNEGDSLVLRWELADPLAAGAGGVLRFRCKVR